MCSNLRAGPVFINAVQAQPDTEPTQADFNARQIAALSYDDCSDNPSSMLSYTIKQNEYAPKMRPCRGCFKVPEVQTCQSDLVELVQLCPEDTRIG